MFAVKRKSRKKTRLLPCLFSAADCLYCDAEHRIEQVVSVPPMAHTLRGCKQKRLRVDLQAVEHFDELRVAVIYDAAVSHIQCIDLSHFLFGEGEVPDIKVLFHAVPVNALGNDHYTPLDIPAQGHLSGGLAIFLSDFR